MKEKRFWEKLLKKGRMRNEILGRKKEDKKELREKLGKKKGGGREKKMSDECNEWNIKIKM